MSHGATRNPPIDPDPPDPGPAIAGMAVPGRASDTLRDPGGEDGRRLAPRLLVIDDERVDRAIVCHAAARFGFAATGVASVREARALLEQGARFRFVVIDLSLDGEDGLEMLHALERFDRRAIVVLASGFDPRILAATQRLAAALGLLVAGVLQKPILPAALLDLLRRAPQAGLPDRAASDAIPPERLRLAIAKGQIRAWFQPKTSLASGAIIGAEALARWQGPAGRFFSPADFIQVAERSGQIAALTESILDQALSACATWRDTRPDCSVAVNLSPLLLEDPGLTDRIDGLLQRHGVPPGALVLEITESHGIPDTTRVMETLTRLRIRGMGLSVDDFGTGHASLLSLVRMPFSQLKIDQAFVREALASSDSRKIVRASASLGRELGLDVVAEGVETEPMALLVRDAGCDAGQGWRYGRAVPEDLFLATLAQTPGRGRAGGDAVAGG